MVGHSRAANAVRRAIATIAPEAGPVLVLGASGTGKEVAAAALHRLSGRAGAFVPVNCGAIAAELAEAELFGHARGALTGAADARRGLFVEADGGTLFLDEVGDMPLALQVKLLRAVEEGTVRPVGGTPRKVDVRIVAATNAGPAALRDDLRARLAEWTLELVPLRRRRADVLPLFAHFATEQLGRAPRTTAELAEALLLHDWPLNVRELQKLARRCAGLAQPGSWDLELLPEALQRAIRERDAPLPEGTPRRDELEAALATARGTVARVAERFGVDRTQVYCWMRRHGIDPGEYRDDA